MKEVFENIKERLEEERKKVTKWDSDTHYIYKEGADWMGEKAIKIVNQVAEEYNQSLANNNQSLTNADKIRSMSNEELAKFLLKVNTAYAEPCMTGETDCKWEDYPDHSRGCKDCFEEWLQQVTGKLKGE